MQSPGGKKLEGLFRRQHVGEWGWFQAGSEKLQGKKMYWQELSLRRKVALLRLYGSFACCFCLTEP